MITNLPLEPQKYYSLCDTPEAGAIIQFIGVVRNNTNSPKKVKGLFYESYKEMANQKIQEILASAMQKFSLKALHCVHRIGDLVVGEIAIVVTTAGAHREETFEANRYVVDRVKYEAPIWKKEIFEDGSSEWGKNSGKKPEFIEE